jgi:hypothetical protein
VPAKVGGVWRLPEGEELMLKQEFQMLSGTLTSGGRSVAVTNGRMRGDEISFSVAGAEYTGRASASTLQGTVISSGRQSSWRAVRNP